MTIHRQQNSPYWYYTFMFRGKVYSRSTKTRSKVKAQQIERRAREKLVSEEFLDEKETITIGEAIDLHLEAKRNLRGYKNLISYKKNITPYLELKQLLHNITSGRLERLVHKLHKEGKSQQTIKHYINFIRGIITTSHKHGYQIALNITYPQIRCVERRVRFLTVKEEQRLLDELDPTREEIKYASEQARQEAVDNYQLVVLLLDLGCRYSELASLKWKDVDLEKKIVALYRSKTGSETLLQMTNRTAAIFRVRRSYVDGTGYVFTSRDGGHRKYAPFAVSKAMQRAGLDGVTLHTLRHTTASRLAGAGMSLYEIGHILGHSRVSTVTSRYAHLVPSNVTQKAVDVLNDVTKAIK